MKKLYITLLSDTSEVSGSYLPGDTLGGHVQLTTSSGLNYTCLRIHLVGLVTTKVGKAEEQVYVMNQQVVLLGNPNNASEFVLDEGKHSWPFQFTIPLQHVPSSGKYRHGTVKYALSATLTSLGLMGGVQELLARQTIIVKDLLNISVEPYSTAVSLKGSSNLRPEADDPRDAATAVVKLSRSGYLKGQRLEVEVDLYHPLKIRRNPGCFIQLIRKENYYAGDHAKEYSDTIASRAEALVVNSSLSTGKIMSELTVPDSALPTLSSTKIITIEYQLVVLFDMRSKTGFMESRHKKTVKSKMRNKLLSCPGGFEVCIPIVIGTLSDSLHTQKPSPFAHTGMSPRQHPPSHGDASTSSMALSGSPTLSAPSSTLSLNVPNGHGRATSSTSQEEPPEYNFERLRVREGPSSGLVLSSLSAGGLESASGLTPLRLATPTYASIRSRSHSAAPSFVPPIAAQHQPPLAESLAKPLPSVPQSQLESQYSPTFHTSPTSLSPSIPEPTWRSFAPPTAASTAGSVSQRSAFGSVPAPALPPRPRPPLSSTFPYTFSVNAGGYPHEKESEIQAHPIPLPVAMSVEMPTAPWAVDLGMGPSSPQAEHLQGNVRPRRLLEPSTPTHVITNGARDYFQMAPDPPLMMALTPAIAATTAPAVSWSQRDSGEGHREEKRDGSASGTFK